MFWLNMWLVSSAVWRKESESRSKLEGVLSRFPSVISRLALGLCLFSCLYLFRSLCSVNVHFSVLQILLLWSGLKIHLNCAHNTHRNNTNSFGLISSAVRGFVHEHRAFWGDPECFTGCKIQKLITNLVINYYTDHVLPCQLYRATSSVSLHIYTETHWSNAPILSTLAKICCNHNYNMYNIILMLGIKKQKQKTRERKSFFSQKRWN